MATGAPEISLGQKYLTTFNPFGISNYGPDSIRDLISLTSPINLRYGPNASNPPSNSETTNQNGMSFEPQIEELL